MAGTMKMKQVCEQTGLTEKAVRLYVKEGLVEPEVTEGLHSNSYGFTGRDVDRLRDIGALRVAGFSLAEIKTLLEHPDQMPEVLSVRRAALDEDIRRKQAVQATLERLTVSEQSDPAELAEALRPVPQAAEERKGASPKSKRIVLLCVAAAILIIYSLLEVFFAPNGPTISGGTVYTGYWSAKLAFLSFLSILLPLFAGMSAFMAFRYAAAPRRAAKLPERHTASVIDVVMDTTMDMSAARSGMTLGVAAAGSRGSAACGRSSPCSGRRSDPTTGIRCSSSGMGQGSYEAVPSSTAG